MFKRTTQGIANEHLFHRVDYVVYCEGEGVDSLSMSLDEVFWTKIFSYSKKKFWVKSIGSKTNAFEILHDVRLGSLKNTIVALDSDYDFFFGDVLEHPQIFFTFGYSWESDVIQDIDFSKALSLFASVRDIPAARQKFADFRKNIERDFWRGCLIDMRYISSPGQLFDRRKPLSILKAKSDGFLKLRTGEIAACARKLKGSGVTPLSFPLDGPTNGLRHFHGKTAARIVYHWFVAFSSKLKNKRNVSYDTFMSILIEFIDIGAGGSRRDHYFKRALASL